MKKKLQKAQNKVKKAIKVVKDAEKFAQAPMAGLGGAIGAKLGSRRIGRGIGGALGKLTGTGDYTVISNSLSRNSRILGDENVPSFGSATGVRVQHREYLGDVVASSVAGAFSIASYSINPGIYQSFPWLSPFATQFDQWCPHGIVVVYRPLSGNVSATGQLARVIIASDYDVKDVSYRTRVEMENSQFATSGNATQCIMHPIECAEKERLTRCLLTRSGPIDASDNVRFFDLCNLQIASAGATASQLLGELWITFDIEFFKAQLYGGLIGRSLQFCDFVSVGASAANPFGTSQTFLASSTFQITASATDLTFPASLTGGTFLVTLLITGGSTATTAPTLTFSAGCGAGPAVLSNGTTSLITNDTGTIQSIDFTVTLTGGPGLVMTVTLGAFTCPTTPTTRCYIAQINPVAGP